MNSRDLGFYSDQPLQAASMRVDSIKHNRALVKEKRIILLQPLPKNSVEQTMSLKKNAHSRDKNSHMNCAMKRNNDV